MKRFRLGFFLAAVLVLFAACSKKSDESSSTTTTTTSTEATASPVAESSVTPEVSSSESPSAASSASPSIAGLVVTFTDIMGDFGEQQIKGDGATSVLDQTSGAFKPDAPISRAEFVHWLVKANNAYHKDAPGKQIRLARTGPAAFVDVPQSHSDYAYIPGSRMPVT